MSILKEADNIINGEKQTEHGDMIQNTRNIAALWSTYLGRHISPEQFAMCMVLVKVGRSMTGMTNKEDILDAAGYLGIIEQIRDHKSRQRQRFNEEVTKLDAQLKAELEKEGS